MKFNVDRLAVMFFVLSIVGLSFIYGIAAHKYKLFPYAPLIRDGIRVIETHFEEPHFLVPIRYDGIGVTIHARKAVSPGVTLVTSYWPETKWKPGIRIIDAEGTTLHSWNVDPEEIWSDSIHRDAFTDMQVSMSYIHGTYLFPNGDVLINLEYLGLVRVDACGAVVWKLPYRTHHSISRDEEGNFWIPAIKWVDVESDRVVVFPGLRPPFGEETAIKVSPTGEVLQEISLLKALFDSEYKRLLWKYRQRTGDLIHVNDVEPLDKDIADKFSSFNVGDLLVSFRNINSVAVLDASGKIKWLESEPFNQQHDPDFEDNGRITIFDNRSDGSQIGEHLGGSIISSINPTSGDLQTIYPVDNSRVFFTEMAGKHQKLENGNRLITEAGAGRIFEIDSLGNVVWEWIHQAYDKDWVPEVLEATRYNISSKVVATWPCGMSPKDEPHK